MRDAVASLFVCAVLFGAGPSAAQPLSIVNIASNNVDCLFATDCSIDPTDIFAEIPMPGIERKAFLMSRTFVADRGSHARGHIAYQYRVDLKNTVPLGDLACVLSVAIEIGPIAQLRYNPKEPPGDIYTITTGVPQNQIALQSAVRNGDAVTFTFGQPVCANEDGANGQTSFFFGLASTASARRVRADVETQSATVEALALAPRTP